MNVTKIKNDIISEFIDKGYKYFSDEGLISTNINHLNSKNIICRRIIQFKECDILFKGNTYVEYKYSMHDISNDNIFIDIAIVPVEINENTINKLNQLNGLY